MKIFKYSLDVAFRPVLNLPVGAQVLSIGVQNGSLVLWAIVDEDETRQERFEFRVYCTGEDLASDAFSDPARFLGTFQIPDRALGLLVLHVWCTQGRIYGRA